MLHVAIWDIDDEKMEEAECYEMNYFLDHENSIILNHLSKSMAKDIIWEIKHEKIRKTEKKTGHR